MVPVLLVCQKRTQSGLKLKGKKITRLSHVHAVYKAIIQWLLALNLMHKSSYGFLICAKRHRHVAKQCSSAPPKTIQIKPSILGGHCGITVGIQVQILCHFREFVIPFGTCFILIRINFGTLIHLTIFLQR